MAKSAVLKADVAVISSNEKGQLKNVSDKRTVSIGKTHIKERQKSNKIR